MFKYKVTCVEQRDLSMDETNKAGLVIAFSVVVVLFLIFGGGALTGATLSNGMMGSGNMGGISWMWLPTLITLGIGILLGWTTFAKA
jgi:hypothetical protein